MHVNERLSRGSVIDRVFGEDWCRPWRSGARPGRVPDERRTGRQTTRVAIRPEVDFQTVRRYRRPLLGVGSIQFRDVMRRAPRAVWQLLADINVGCERDRRSVPVAIEKELRRSTFVVFEVGRPAFASGSVHATGQWGGSPPGEIVVHVITIRGPDVICLGRDAPGNKEEPVLVPRKTGLCVVAGAVHSLRQPDGLLPRTV